ncbi:MAG: M48 family metalloprotease [Bacteroidales bacterium]|nr:M48 family metalloprotease [Bacteroidales bacterium]
MDFDTASRVNDISCINFKETRMVFFLFAFLWYAIMLTIRVVLIFIASKYYKEPIKDNMDINVISILVEASVITLGLGSFFWIINNYANSPWILIAAIVLMVSFIPSYNFLISPLQYLFFKKTYYRDKRFEQLLANENYIYNIRIVKGNLNNAYATGILPYTKTILIGEKLVKNMTWEQIQGIVFHEIGHLKYKHLNRLYFANLLIFPIFYCLSLLRAQVPMLNNSLFMQYLSVFLVGTFWGLLLWYIPGKIQYKLELQADSFAASVIGNENMISALKRLHELGNNKVPKWNIAYPTLDKRVENIGKQQL